MNESHPHHRPAHSNESFGPIPLPSVMPPELVDTSRLLDALGERDRASAPAGLEGRLLTSLKAGVLPKASPQESDETGEASQRMERLAQVEQAAASRMLEDRIFMATRGILVFHAVKRGPEVHVRKRRPGWFASGGFAMRAAAGLLLGGGVIWGYLALRPANSGSPNFGNSRLAVQRLEKEIDGHMDQLGDIFALAMVDSSNEYGRASTDDAGDTGDNWYQYDLLDSGDSL